MSSGRHELLVKISSIDKLPINLFLSGGDEDRKENANHNKKKSSSLQNIHQHHKQCTTSEKDLHKQDPPYKAKKLGDRLRAMRQNLDLNFDRGVTPSNNGSQRQHNYNSANRTQFIFSDAEPSTSSNDTSTSTLALDDSIGLRENPTLLMNNSINTSFGIQSPESVFEKFYKTFRDDVIRQELKLLSKHHQEGVWVMPSCESLQVWFGVLIVKQGPYQDGVLHFTVFFKDDFPESVPVIRFRSRVFHPKVEIRKGTFNSSELTMNIDKSNKLPSSKSPPGSKGRVYVWQLLKYLRDSFHHIDVTHATNETAAILYQRENKQEFMKECRNCVQRSIDAFHTQNTFGVSNMTTENIINNPFKSTLVDDVFYKGFVQFLVANEDRNRHLGYNGTSLAGSAFSWAKNQLGKVLNNLNTSYSSLDGYEEVS